MKAVLVTEQTVEGNIKSYFYSWRDGFSADANCMLVKIHPQIFILWYVAFGLGVLLNLVSLPGFLQPIVAETIHLHVHTGKIRVLTIFLALCSILFVLAGPCHLIVTSSRE